MEISKSNVLVAVEDDQRLEISRFSIVIQPDYGLFHVEPFKGRICNRKSFIFLFFGIFSSNQFESKDVRREIHGFSTEMEEFGWMK